jgi:hypothetical protein
MDLGKKEGGSRFTEAREPIEERTRTERMERIRLVDDRAGCCKIGNVAAAPRERGVPVGARPAARPHPDGDGNP